ncbi:hypothetical protein E2C01_056209 [Portunus trituberculatus]|uniref:Uncharacterized protein n=1 Tax=Portunus trituberculatus TaxID=210409 RepID=A0A5B7GWY7_PORTR|nr:hypothetical protein [Portunus trituberculatus]
MAHKPHHTTPQKHGSHTTPHYKNMAHTNHYTTQLNDSLTTPRLRAGSRPSRHTQTQSKQASRSERGADFPAAPSNAAG